MTKPTKAEILAAADKIERLPNRSRALLRTLADLTEDRPAAISQADMAMRHNRSVSWVRLACEPLIAVGIVRRHRARNGAEKTRYTLHLPNDRRPPQNGRQARVDIPAGLSMIAAKLETLTTAFDALVATLNERLPPSTAEHRAYRRKFLELMQEEAKSRR